MKKLITLTLSTLLALSLAAQQEQQLTQFMNFKMGFNPAVAGNEHTTVITALVRSQWLGLEGAPQSQMLSFNMPVFNERVGIGANLIRHTIGLTERYELDAVYTYRIPWGRGHLSAGLQGTVRLIRTDYNEAVAIQPIESDPAIPMGVQSKYVPNFGFGVYYESQKFYLGFSIPRFLQNNIDLADSDDVLTREVRHFYLMGGWTIPVSEKVALTPQFLLKYVKGAPFDADINLNVEFLERFTTGVSYRIGGSKTSSLGESASLLVGVDITEKLMFGISYDATLSELKSYNNGSVEGVLKFLIGGKTRKDKGKDDNRNFNNDFYR